MSRLIAPSILSSDFANLQSEIEMLNGTEADWIHVDVMDGVFVPNITIGMPVIKKIHAIAKKPLDVHLMIVEPEQHLQAFHDAGAYLLNVHYEASTHLHRTVQQIKSLGMKAGVTLNPHSPVSVLEEIIPDLDLVLIMSVNPGFGGQKFIPNSLDKVRRCKDLILKRNSNALIEIDGGVGTHNAAEVYSAGVDVIVAGNAVFSANDPAGMIREIKYAKE